MRIRLPVIALIGTIVVGCSSSTNKTPTTTATGVSPEIASVSPPNAPLDGGGYAVLRGLGFKAGAVVTVGGANSIAVTVADGQTLTFKMPAGRPGPADLVVQNPDGGKNVFLQAVNYQAATAALPTLTHVSPNSGPASGGTVVSLVGTGFTEGAVLIVAGAPAATLTIVSPTQASATIPHHAGSGTADVIFTNADGQSAVLFGGYAYADSLPGKPPKLTDVAPNEGSVEGGNRTLIKVDNLGTGALLFIGGRPVAYDPAAGGVSATMPGAKKHGLVDIAVTNADGQSDILPGAYNYVEGRIAVPPALARVTPPVGPPAGGGRVLIEGDGFQDGAQVLFGGKTATGVVVAGQHALSCIVPPGDPGAVSVTLQNPDGGLVTLQQGFSYQVSTAAAPTVTAVAPNTGPSSGGTVALVSGTGFQAGAIVLVGGRPADLINIVDASTSTARFPALPAGSADVTVTNPDGQSGTLHAAFAVAATVSSAAPRVNGVTPQGGPIEGGNSAIITGDGFQPGIRAFVGGKPAAAALAGPNALALNIPEGDTTGNADIAVTNPDGQSDVLPGGYNYFNAPPVITALSTTCGAASGGTPVLISGRSFRPGVSATIGGQPLTGLVRQDSSTLVGTTGAAHAGAGDAVVTNPDGQADSIGGGFYFTDATHPCQSTNTGQLALRRVVPNDGPLTGKTVITLVGDGFVAGLTVKFGDTAATDVRLLGTGALTVTLPSSTHVGPTDVSVSLPDGRLSRLAGAFDYFDPTSNLPAPSISAIAPSAGPNTGGSVVQITGSNFAPHARVFFGATPAGLPTLIDANHMVAVTPNSLPGPIDVTVMNSDGKSATLALGFAFYPVGAAGAPPVAQRVEPSIGSTLTPKDTFVFGSGFQPGALVFFGGVPATRVVSQPDSSLAVTVAPQAAGTVDVVVTNPDGQSSTISQGFTFAAPAPHIGAVLPAIGPPAGGTTVVISGSGFGSGDIVLFGGAPAAVKVLDDTALFATLPAHAAGFVNVDLSRGGTIVDTKIAGFEYHTGFVLGTPPTVSTLEPATGPVSGGTVLWLTGSNYMAGMQVFFGPNPAPKVLVADGGHAVVTTPSGIAGFANVNIVNPDGQAGALPHGFSYVDDALLSGFAPRLTAVTPDHGPETTATVDILTGRNFVAGEYVFVGAAQGAGVRLLSPSIIDTTFPFQAAGVVDVAVTHPDGRSSVLPQSFTYQARPTVVSVADATPGSSAGSSGPTRGATPVTIAGTGFQAGATVTFRGAPATSVVVASASVITAITPAGTAGLADVRVIDPDGQTGVLSNGWLYVAPPVAQSIWPPTGPAAGGTIALVTGTDFSPRAVAYVSGNQVETVFGSSTSLAITLPPGSGSVDVIIKNPDGQSSTLSSAFAYKTSGFGLVPTLANVNPGTGPDTGNSFVSVAGTNFVTGTTVILAGSALARNLVATSSTITGLTPAHAAGPVRVAVTTPDGQSVRIDAGYVYVDHNGLGAPPLVTGAVPSSAPAAPGGSTASIVGSGFQTGALVFVQGKPAATQGGIQQGGTVISATLPTAQPGLADVAVTNPDGQTSIAAGIFTFTVPPPQFDGTAPVTPAKGPTSGQTAVAIKGSYFQPPVLVYFGQSTARIVSQNDHEIDVLTPAGVNGAVAVVVINKDGQSASLPGAFLYQAPPVITRVSPTSGAPQGGNAVVIQGQYFSGSSTTMHVMFGNAVAPITSTPTSTVIQVTAPTSTAAGQLTVAVSVTNDDGQMFTLPGGYVYLPPAQPPLVSGVTPNAGPLQGNNTITVLGANFQSGATVSFGPDSAHLTQASSVLVTSDGALNCVVPAGSGPGAVGITVTNPDGKSSTLPDAYTYVTGPPPAQLSVIYMNPGSGVTTGGTRVIIGGTGFQNGATVVLAPYDGSACDPLVCGLTNVQVLGPTAISATIPPQPAGGAANYNVRVTNSNGGQVTLLNAWSYGLGTRRWTATGLRMPMESNNGKTGRGISGLYTPAWMGVVGDFTRSQESVSDVWMGGTSNRAPRLLQGAVEVAGAPQRVFSDFTANQKNPDGSTMRDYVNYYEYRYQPYKPLAMDLDGNGWQDVVFWNDWRNAFTVEWNSNGVLQASEYGNPYSYNNPTDYTGGYDYTKKIVDLNLDGFPDFVMAVDGRSYVMLSCGAGTASPYCATTSAPSINVAINPGQQTITNDHLAGWYYNGDLTQFLIAGHTRLMIDYGPASETVTVSAVTPTSFTATFAQSHGASAAVSMVFDTVANTAVAANTDAFVNVPTMEGFGLTPYLYLVADPGTPNEERVQINNTYYLYVLDYAGSNVKFHFNKAHAAGFRLTSKDPHYFVADTSRFPANAQDHTYTVVAGDIDGDGDIDVITGTQQQGIKVWLNDAANRKTAGLDPNGFQFTLSTASAIPSGIVGGNVRALALADFNGDGQLDLLVGYDGNSQERLFINQGFGVFSDETSASNGTGCAGGVTGVPRLPLPLNDSIVRYDLRDFGKHGALDVLAWVQVNGTQGSFQKQLRYWINDGKGCFTGGGNTPGTPNQTDVLFPASKGVQQTWNYALGDFDKNGFPGMIAAFESVQTREYVNVGGQFLDKTLSNFPNASDPADSVQWWRWTYGSMLVDVNGDGYPDLITTQFNVDPRTNNQNNYCYSPQRMCYLGDNGGVKVYLNDQKGNFPHDDTLTVFPTTLDPTGQKKISALPIASWSMDNTPALWAGGPQAILIGSATEYQNGTEPLQLKGTYFDSAVGSHRLLINNGNGTFVDATYPRLPTGRTFTFASSVKFVDLDNDGNVDIVIGDAASGQIMVWQNTGNGYFVDVTSTAVQPYPLSAPYCGNENAVHQIIAANIDKDNLNRQDLLLVRECESRLLINKSDTVAHTIRLVDESTCDGTFCSTPRLPTPPPGAISAVVADIDCIGGPDIFFLQSGTGNPQVFLNSTNCTGGAPCGFFKDASSDYLAKVGACIGTDCGGNAKAIGIKYDSANTDIFIARYSGDGQVRPHRLLKNRCGPFDEFSQAAWAPIPTDNDKITDVVSGSIFVNNKDPNAVLVPDLMFFGYYAQRVYQNSP